MKRIFLFLATNIAILVVLSIAWFVISSVFGLQPMQGAGGGLNHGTLLVFSLIFGFGGAFISLWLSKPIAKWSTGAKVIEKPSNSAENWLLSTVQRQARQAGIGMPEVAIFDSPEPNAFATGATRNSSLVAVSSGLLQGMKQDEVEAVLAHEVSHIANGDMVTLTLIQGVLNTFVIFLSRVIGHFIDRVILKNEQGYGLGYFASVIVLQILLGIAASAVVCWFSRKREFRADAGGAQLAGRRKMVDALSRLQSYQGGASTLPENMSAFGIRGGAMAKLFSTHPPLEARIAALQQAAG